MEPQALIPPHDQVPSVTMGPDPQAAEGALILIHGRNAAAPNILEIVADLAAERLHVVAPNATDNTWYPKSFLAPIHENEPGISSGIARINHIVEDLMEQGIPVDKIVIGGFSQGACLAAEFVAQHPRSYGGVLIYSGGIIGPEGLHRSYLGSLSHVPVFLGCSDVDSHVPAWRVEETAEVLATLGASIDMRFYPGMGHLINAEELAVGRELIQQRILTS